MNMASTGTLFFIFTVILCISKEDAKNASLTIVRKPQHVGQHGQQSLLECVVQTTNANIEIRSVSWRKQGQEKALLIFHDGKITQQQSGYRLAEPSGTEKNINVSLLIDNTTLTDAGVYKCTVIANTFDDDYDTTLTVTANYSQPVIRSIPEKIAGKAEGTLICDSDGGYPKGEIRWFEEGKTEQIEGSTMEVHKAQNGLFHLSSKLTLRQGSISSKYTCVVFSASGGKEAETGFEVLYQQSPAGHDGRKELDAASKIVAPVVVIGSLLIGLLVVVLVVLYRRRARRPHQEVSRYDSDVEEGHSHEEDDKLQSSQI